MKILKKGKLQTIIFTCETCGCVFEANATEYDYHRIPIFDDNKGMKFIESISIACPFCKHMISKLLNEEE